MKAMVDDRQAAILRAVVQQYIETSQPVSSSTVAVSPDVQASSATVRSEMASLEREGFLAQPHTSAGRVPTDRGYRFFVDALDAPTQLRAAQQQDVRTFFDRASGELEQMLHETGRLLTDLTGAAAVVVGDDDGHDATTVRSAQLVALGPRTALAVLVLSNGDVEKRHVDLPEHVTEDNVTAASARLDTHLVGSVMATAPKLPTTNNRAVDRLAAAGLLALQRQPEDDAGHIYVGGAARLAAAFDAVDTVRGVLTVLEEQLTVVTLIRELLDRGVSVAIGEEHQVLPLAHCSLVVAPTVVDGERRGSVAVLGPTRMDYGQAIAAVAVVSQHLGNRLAAGPA